MSNTNVLPDLRSQVGSSPVRAKRRRHETPKDLTELTAITPDRGHVIRLENFQHVLGRTQDRAKQFGRCKLEPYKISEGVFGLVITYERFEGLA